MKTKFTSNLLLLSILILVACKKSETKKPFNVVWLVAEDLSPDYLNAYGDFRAPTPNLDRLAKEGVVYTNNFSVSGVCSPSRATLATGLYPNSFGAQNMRTLNQQPVTKESGIIDYQVVPPPAVKMVSEIMRENGYYTSNNAKEDYHALLETQIPIKSEIEKKLNVFDHIQIMGYEEVRQFQLFFKVTE